MKRGEEPEPYLVEQIRTALARDPRVHELGLRVTVLSVQRKIFLAGVVATVERRERIVRVVHELLPHFAVHNEIAVEAMASPDRETL